MIEKTILIIGGTGALGKTLTERYYKDNKIIILSRDEHKHVAMQRKYPDVEYIIGDVKDKDSILQALNEFKPHVVINTAALKHVPICESNPYESVKTNIIGHKNLIDCVSICNHLIETLMFISTDKACAPINVYGQCKAISERLYIDYAEQQTDIKVCLVRYGNVLESTGSVIPYFKKLLNDGATKLPITDMRMTRFLLTLNRACDLIDFAYNNDTHGCIAIPKVLSFSIPSIARALMSSYNVDTVLETVGIRPGEKLHEAMISEIEWMRTIDVGENYLITNKIQTTESKSYNSHDALMPDEDVYEFLKKCKVI